jgi:hypothetical protein
MNETMSEAMRDAMYDVIREVMGDIVGAPDLSIGDDYSIEVGNPLSDTPFNISFVMATRNGTTVAMPVETAARYQLAVDALANGIEVEPELADDCEESDYPYTRVLISFGNIPVLVDGKHIWKKALIFTEKTTPAQFVAAMRYSVIELDSRLEEIGVVRAPCRSNARNGGGGNSSNPQPATRSESGTAIYADFPGKKHCRANHAGQVIRCNIAEIEVNMVGGKRQYVIRSTYQGEGISQYAMATTGDEYIKHQPTVQYLRGLEYDSHLVEMTGAFYVNVKPEKEMTIDGEKKMITPTYLNLNKIDLTDEQIQKLQEAAEMDQSVPEEYEQPPIGEFDSEDVPF